MKKIYTDFQRETLAMLIESASWNDHNLEWYKDVTIERFWADYINEDNGIIYSNLDLNEETPIWGTCDELRNDFEIARNTLWYSGVLTQVYSEHKEYNLDDCYDYLEDTTFEMCPICESEVELDFILKTQVCPVCGQPILPCSICDMDIAKCTECPLKDTCKRDTMSWQEYKTYKEDGDTSYVEFDKCHDLGNDVLKAIRELCDYAQNHNVNQSAIDNLDSAIEEIQKFCNNMMDCKCNCYDAYKKHLKR